jgi:alcohol dehydrogenase (NADP+)
MISAKAFGVESATAKFKQISIERRKPNPDDIVIEISYCGICHSDIHTARGEWGGTVYPCVPGHEIVGVVSAVGKKVKKFKVGDYAGVGCFIDACTKCTNCRNGEEQFCEKGAVFTYNSPLPDGSSTKGGYSSHITVKEKFAYTIKKGVPLERVAPLLCAGITTYTPLKRYGVKSGKKVGVVGLGGLGHMAVKLAAAMGAEVTVFSTSPNKEKDAKKLGARKFIVTKDLKNFDAVYGALDLILDTVSAKHDLSPYLGSLKLGGVHVLLGVAPDPSQIEAFSLIGGRKVLTGSLIGGTDDTQEMLDFCARKKVFSDIELIGPDKIDEAYTRTVNSDVKYRFVLDMR